jgi:peroxin-11B
LQAALRATTGTGPMGEQITTIGRQLGYAGYLAYDSIIWVNRLDISAVY